jgi:hypothetical protein
MVAAFLLYLAIQQVENIILVPKIQGDATKLHPAVVIFALILGGAVAGLLGAILALPVAATLRDLYVYAFRRASGQSAEDAATGDARGTHDAGPPGLEPWEGIALEARAGTNAAAAGMDGPAGVESAGIGPPAGGPGASRP